MPAATPKEILQEIILALQNIEQGNPYVHSKKADKVFQSVLKFFIFFSTSPLAKTAFETSIERLPSSKLNSHREISGKFAEDDFTKLAVSQWIDGFIDDMVSLFGVGAKTEIEDLHKKIQALYSNKEKFQKEVTEMRIFCKELIETIVHKRINFISNSLSLNNSLLSFLKECFTRNIVSEMKANANSFLTGAVRIQSKPKTKPALFSALGKISEPAEASYQAAGELFANIIESEGQAVFFMSPASFTFMTIIFLAGFFMFLPSSGLAIAMWLWVSAFLGPLCQQRIGFSNFSASSLTSQEADFIGQKLQVLFQLKNDVEQEIPQFMKTTRRPPRDVQSSGSVFKSVDDSNSRLFSAASDTSEGILAPRNPAYRPTKASQLSVQEDFFQEPAVPANVLNINWEFQDVDRVQRRINYNSLTNERIVGEDKVIVFYPFKIRQATYFIWWNEVYVMNILNKERQENLFQTFNMLVTAYNPLATTRKGNRGLIYLMKDEIKEGCAWKLKQLSALGSHYRLYFKEIQNGRYRLLVPWKLLNE